MQAVSDQAVGVGLIRGVKPDQQLVKVVVSLSRSGYSTFCKIKLEGTNPNS